MGLKSDDMLRVVSALSASCFYQSMTCHGDSTSWQDVYHAPTPNHRTHYIKIILRQSVPVIQFKET